MEVGIDSYFKTALRFMSCSSQRCVNKSDLCRTPLQIPLACVETRKPTVRDVGLLDATARSSVPASTCALPATVLPVATPAAAYHDDDASTETAVKTVSCDASSLIPDPGEQPSWSTVELVDTKAKTQHKRE